MSRSLEADVEALERKAEHKVAAIRRVMLEYNDSLDPKNEGTTDRVSRKQHEMEGIVAEYLKLYKAIRRIRKKLRATEN